LTTLEDSWDCIKKLARALNQTTKSRQAFLKINT